MSIFIDIQDTIYALATPPGIGAIGVIRLSGPRSFDIINELFPAKNIAAQKSHTIHVGFLQNGDHILDEVVLSLFKNPHSYTGEDVVEISCHGSTYIQQQVMKILELKGARMALPGEFTQRSFLNGKMDLAQAESVADIIAADSEAAQQTALKQLRGEFSNEMNTMREQLINFAALIELELDFSQEDVEFADRAALRILIDKIYFTAQSLLDSFALGNVIKKGVSVAIVGKPNTGKSTLLNTLLNEDRAIVSNIAGTTRDTIEEVLNIKGIIFRLIDTAGIRDNTSDEIEQIGVGKSLEKINSSDIVVYLIDGSIETQENIISTIKKFSENGKKILFVVNKVDLLNTEQIVHNTDLLEYPLIYISAKNKESIDLLQNKLYETIIKGEINTENTIITNARHEVALKKVLESLKDIKTGMDKNISGDLIAPDIRKCLHYLGEITGQVEVDRDILGTIFGKFCIGK